MGEAGRLLLASAGAVTTVGCIASAGAWCMVMYVYSAMGRDGCSDKGNGQYVMYII